MEGHLGPVKTVTVRKRGVTVTGINIRGYLKFLKPSLNRLYVVAVGIEMSTMCLVVFRHNHDSGFDDLNQYPIF